MEKLSNIYNGNEESLNLLKNNILKSGEVGKLVANNFRSSIIEIPLLEKYINPANNNELIKLDYHEFSKNLRIKLEQILRTKILKFILLGLLKKLVFN